MTIAKLVTVDEFMQLTGDGRFDLIDGEVQTMPPAGGWHGQSGSRLIRLLGNYTESMQAGAIFTLETAFMLSRGPDTVLCPDVAFVRQDRLPQWAERHGALPLAPDLAVEVRSLSETGPSVRRKVDKYLGAGVRLVWVIDPQRRNATVFRADGSEQQLSEADALDGEDVLPGFSVRVGALFD